MERKNTGFLNLVEEFILSGLVRLAPQWITPDMLTFIALASIFLAAVSYAFVTKAPEFLFLVNFFIFLHWLGDSLDGRLARFRQIQRPKYGFYVDHFCDSLSVFFIAIGLLLSSLVKPEILFLGSILILLSLIHTYLLTVSTNVFNLSIGLVGGTEARVILVLFNFALYIFGNPKLKLFNFQIKLVDFLSYLAIFLTIIILSKTFFTTACKLHSQDTKSRLPSRKKTIKN